MIELKFIRHGKTLWNTQGRAQGMLDSPLSEDSVLATVEKGRQLKDDTYLGAYCSPLGRAVKSMEIILGENQNHNRKFFIIDSRLRENTLGIYDGYTYEEMVKMNPALKAFSHNLLDYGIEGAESYSQIYDRAKDFITNEIMTKFEDEIEAEEGYKILIVSHGTMIRSFIAYLDHKGPDEIKNVYTIKNLEEVIYRIEGKDKKIKRVY